MRMCTHAGRKTMTSFLLVNKASSLNTLSLVSQCFGFSFLVSHFNDFSFQCKGVYELLEILR